MFRHTAVKYQPVVFKLPCYHTFSGIRRYSSFPKQKKSSHTFLKVVSACGLVGATLYATNDTVRETTKHVYYTGKRIGVVTVATVRCFNIYRNVLGKEFEDQHDRNKALSEAHTQAAKITLKALERNGGVYIKLGQHVSALTYLLPKEWTDTMIPLQDRCPRSSIEEIEQMFITDTGQSLDSIFSEFDPEPVGVASLAQVHVAVLRDSGEKVAVKVQHPSLAEFVPLDIFMTRTVFDLMYKVFPEYPLTWLGDEMQNSIYVELDFVNEAQNAERTAEYFKRFKKETALRIPKVVSASKRILVMEYLAGARLDDLDYIRKNKINPAEVSSCLSHIFNNMIFLPGAGLHCDPHGGNLAIRKVEKSESGSGHNFEIVLYDHGLYRYIPVQMKRDYAHLWLAILDNNVPEMKHYAEKVAYVKGHRKFQIFAAAITGRDPDTAMNYDISKARTSEEVSSIKSQVYSEEGVLEDLMDILSNMPRMVLLILKTNDLTRNLDENLDNPLGPERTFLILANYCAKVVYEESKEKDNRIYKKGSIKWMFHRFQSWLAYERRKSALYIYDIVMLLKGLRRQLFF